jgi:hypothetical protein
MTLRYLTRDDSYVSLQYLFTISKHAITLSLYITKGAMYAAGNTEARSRGKAIRVLLIGLCVRARALACMWVRRRVGVCMSVSACSLANPARNAYAPCCDVICGPSDSTQFFDIISQRCNFRKKAIDHKMCFTFL